MLDLEPPNHKNMAGMDRDPSIYEEDGKLPPQNRDGPVPPWMPEVPSRTMPRAEDVLNIFGAWAIFQYRKMQQVYWQKGGWEGWAQVELALGISQQYPSINCFREEQVYEDSLDQADLTLTNSTEQTHIIELKTESLFQDARGIGSFTRNFKDDMRKISMQEIASGYRRPNGAIAYAIGFTLSDQVNKYVLKADNWFPYQATIKFKELVTETSEVPALYMWYFTVEWPAMSAKESTSTSRAYSQANMAGNGENAGLKAFK